MNFKLALTSTAIAAMTLAALPAHAQEGWEESTTYDDSYGDEPGGYEDTAGPGSTSWDMEFGGIPRGGTLHAEMGFSGLPRLAYHYGSSPSFSIGGMFSFDYAYWAPRAAFNPAILLQAPMRLRLVQQNQLSVGLKLDPGLGFFFYNQFVFGILLNMGVNLGYAVNHQIIIGGGMDMPLAIWIGDGGSGVVIPILFGPVFEFHVTPAVAITFEAKFGPWIGAGDVSGTTFGLKLNAGVAYRF